LVVEAARCDLGEDVFPAIRLHDARHTHAALRGTPVNVAQERLGHASPVITLTIYAHVLPGMQAAAAKLYGKLMTRS
jgi:integrase